MMRIEGKVMKNGKRKRVLQVNLSISDPINGTRISLRWKILTERE